MSDSTTNDHLALMYIFGTEPYLRPEEPPGRINRKNKGGGIYVLHVYTLILKAQFGEWLFIFFN